MNVAVFASGAGTTLESLLKAQSMGVLRVNVSLLITDSESAGALKVATQFGIKCYCLPVKKFKDFTAWELAIAEALRQHKVDAVLLLGFLRKVGPAMLAVYKGRMINSHPSLLPHYGGKGMYGLRVHEAVIRAGETQTGVTIHEVSEEYDKGKILKQVALDIMPQETAKSLEGRVKALEKKVLIDFLNDWAPKSTD